jgi:hypothetical protein
MVQHNPAIVAIETHHNTRNQLKWLTRTCSFAPGHSNIVVLKKISYFAFVGQGCPDRLFWGKFLNKKWASIKAKEIIGSYLHEPVQG